MNQKSIHTDALSAAIIIPAWNEEKTIRRSVQSVLRYGKVIVVDDGSKDKTKSEALAAGAVVISHETNKGYDVALNTGFQKAVQLGCCYAITFDADGQHDPSAVGYFLDRLKEGYNLVLGVRSKSARIVEKIFSFYAKIFFGIQDPLCGLKGYHLSLYSQRGWFDSYSSIGTELALWAKKQGARTIQLEIPIKERKDAPRFGRILRANARIFRSLLLSVPLIFQYRAHD